jgi:two-component system, NarL family, sensor histidine kinase DevS
MHADEVLANGFQSVGLARGGVFGSGMPAITAAFRHPTEAFTDVGQRPAIVLPLRSEHIVLGVMVVARHIDQARFGPEMSTS